MRDPRRLTRKRWKYLMTTNRLTNGELKELQNHTNWIQSWIIKLLNVTIVILSIAAGLMVLRLCIS